MAEIPSTVFVKHRPIRVASLIDIGAVESTPEKFHEVLDGIVRENHETWGGRTNPIVFFRNSVIRAEDWRYLELADVDCITALNPLPVELLGQLDERLSPISVVAPDVDGRRLSRQPEGITIYPTPETLRTFGEKKLLMFEFVDCDPVLERFVHLRSEVGDQKSRLCDSVADGVVGAVRG